MLELQYEQEVKTMRKRLKESEETEYLNFNLPASTKYELEKLAASTNRKKAEILREALDNYLQRASA
jgi:predicted DNA-binding protein